jgi:hypothetical protein
MGIYPVFCMVNVTCKPNFLCIQVIFFSLSIFVLKALFPQLIILRIAQENAWTRTTSKELTRATKSIVFAGRENAHATVSDMQFALDDLHTHSSPGRHGAATTIDDIRMTELEQGDQ